MADPRARVILEAKRRGAAAFKSFQADLGAVAAKAALVGTAAAAALTLVTKRSFETLDALAKTSDTIRISTESLAGLHLAGQITGVGQDQLNKALLRQIKTVSDARNGLSTATRALDQLGLTYQDLINLSPDQQFKLIADRIGDIENVTLRAGAAADIFGARNVAVLNTLDLGREGLEAFADQADRLGIAISRVDAAQIEQANDAIELARQRVQGVGNVIAVKLAPIVTAVATEFYETGASAETMGQTVERVIDSIAVGVGIVADAFHGWRVVFATVEAGVAQLQFRVIQAQEWLRNFASNAEEQKRLIEEAFQLQINVATSPQQIALLEEARDIQTASLQSDAARVDEARLLAEEAHRVAEALASSVPPSERITLALQQARVEARMLAEEQAARVSVPNAEVEVPDGDGLIEFEADLAHRRIEVVRNMQEVLTRLTQEGETARERFTKMSSKQQAAHVVDTLVNMTAGVATTNKKLFALNKAAAVAAAIVNTAQGVTRTLAEYPVPLNFALAATVAAAGAAQIQAIKSTSFGGGTTPSLAGSTGTVNNQPVLPAPPTTSSDPRGDRERPIINNFYVTGSIDDETAIKIGTAINRVHRDRDFSFTLEPT